MIKRQDVVEAIAECNGVKKPNAHTCIMLAAFYTILDHIDKEYEEQSPVKYSFESKPEEEITYNSETEFSQAIQGKEPNDILKIIDELMSTIQVLYPRLYDGVMIKIAG